ncbi:MAG: hypothetical protein RLZ25_461 [Pseudomonadota bacterium]
MTRASPAKRQTFFDAIWSSVIWTTLDRAAALFKHAYVASMIGLTAEVDVFYMAVAIITLFVFSWGRIAEVLAVPRLVELINLGKREEANRLSADLFSFSIAFSIVVGFALNLIWPLVTHIAWGFDNERLDLLKESINWAQPLLFLYIPTRMLYSLSKAHRAFYVSYRNEFIVTLTILGIIKLYPESKGVLIWSFSAGTLVAFLTTLASSWRFFGRFGNPWSMGIRAIVPFAPALLAMFTIQHLYTLIDKGFVSYLPEGFVSVIAYSWTLTTLAPSLLQMEGAFITVYTEAKQNPEVRSDTVNKLLSASITLGLMMSLTLFGFGEDAVALLLERGKFSPEDTHKVAGCLTLFSPSIIPLLLMKPLGQIFQVENRVKLVIRRLIFGMIVNVVCCYFFLFEFKLGPNGIALATSISQWAMVLTALLLMQRIQLHIHYLRHLGWLITMLFFGLLDLHVAESLRQTHPSHWMIVPSGLVFLGLFLLPIALGRSRESLLARTLLGRSFRKIGLGKRR